MDDNLLENFNLEIYESTSETLDNICAVCLDPLNGIPLLPQRNEICSDTDSCDSSEFVDIELASADSSRQNSESILWTCHNCNKTFHLNCIHNWARNKPSFDCPTCRHTHTLSITILDTNNTLQTDVSQCCHCTKSTMYLISVAMFGLLVLLIFKFIFPHLL